MKILIVEDEARYAAVLMDLLRGEGHADVRHCGSVEQALRELDHEAADLVLTDLRLPGASGLDLLQELGRRPVPPAVILMTAFADVDTARQALKDGALDYLVKPFEDTELLELVDRVAARSPDGEGLQGLLGASPAMRQVFQQLQQAAASDATVLLLGESGTGKEVAAQTIHRLSDRRSGRLIDVHLAALPSSVLESELFGHEQGAFTGADRRKPGLCEMADGGTLFLDEIGELPAAVQTTLLRVLQDQRCWRVGATEAIQVDFRLVAATNRDLATEVAAGRFREDLYYRLDVFTMTLPPLRERGDDVLLLANHFLARDDRPRQLAAEAAACLQAYRWPGNVRELANVCERACLLAPGEIIALEHLPERLHQSQDTAPVDEALDHEAHERQLIEAALQQAGGNKTKAAELLGITRRRLYSRLDRLGLSG